MRRISRKNRHKTIISTTSQVSILKRHVWLIHKSSHNRMCHDRCHKYHVWHIQQLPWLHEWLLIWNHPTHEDRPHEFIRSNYRIHHQGIHRRTEYVSKTHLNNHHKRYQQLRSVYSLPRCHWWWKQNGFFNGHHNTRRIRWNHGQWKLWKVHMCEWLLEQNNPQIPNTTYLTDIDTATFEKCTYTCLITPKWRDRMVEQVQNWVH